eukprot:GDKJ01049979.1.p1 GENE.GDKJ01049979.1~~GDKJ01049979.1.p1  ORF type:complete len:676 (-),score=117.16 GDKJ01049979.1:113-2140(-)
MASKIGHTSLDYQIILQECIRGALPCVNPKCTSTNMQWTHSSDLRLFRGRILSCVDCGTEDVCAHCFVSVQYINTTSNSQHHEDCPYCSDVNMYRPSSDAPREILEKTYERILKSRSVISNGLMEKELAEISSRFYTSDCQNADTITPTTTPPPSHCSTDENPVEQFPLPSPESMAPHLKDALARPAQTVLLLGLTGAGKSSTGCFLSNDPNAFVSGRSLESVTSELSVKEYTYKFKTPLSSKSSSVDPHTQQQPSSSSIASQRFLLVDCPGFMDTRGETVTEDALERLALLTPSGIDSILIVIDGSQRFGEEAITSLQMIAGLLSSNAKREGDGTLWDRVVICFTRETGRDVSKRLADLNDNHPLRVIVDQCKWRVWKTENHHWKAIKAFQQNKERNDASCCVSREKSNVVCPSELEGVTPPPNWYENVEEDREIIHQLLVTSRLRVKGTLDPDVCRAVRKAREDVGLEYSDMLVKYEHELKDLEKRRRRGEISTEMYKKRLVDMQATLANHRKQMAKLEIEGMRKAMETRHELLRFAGKTSMVLVGAAGVAFASVAAVGALATAAPSIAAGGVGAWLWTKARGSTASTVADVALTVGRSVVRHSIMNWMRSSSNTPPPVPNQPQPAQLSVADQSANGVASCSKMQKHIDGDTSDNENTCDDDDDFLTLNDETK